MKVFFSRPPERCQERRTPPEPTPSSVAVPPSFRPPSSRQDREHERASGQRCRRTSLNRRQPFEKEGEKEGRKNIGEGEQEIRHVVR